MRKADLEPAPKEPSGFCRKCGAAMVWKTLCVNDPVRAVCPRCNYVQYNSPAVLVVTSIAAENKLLLVKRGTDPYAGQWALPGGYVEAFESVEGAAVREAQEEAGIDLRASTLIPSGLFSLPHLNQVHVVFFVKLEKMVAVSPNLPETTDARWFAEEEFPADIWAPAGKFDISLIYRRLRDERFDFYHLTDDYVRLVSDGTAIKDIWRKE